MARLLHRGFSNPVYLLSINPAVRLGQCCKLTNALGFRAKHRPQTHICMLFELNRIWRLCSSLFLCNVFGFGWLGEVWSNPSKPPSLRTRWMINTACICFGLQSCWTQSQVTTVMGDRPVAKGGSVVHRCRFNIEAPITRTCWKQCINVPTDVVLEIGMHKNAFAPGDFAQTPTVLCIRKFHYLLQHCLHESDSRPWRSALQSGKWQLIGMS